MTAKNHLVAAYEAAILEQGPSGPLTIKIKQVINITYPDLGASLTHSSALNGEGTVQKGTRKPIEYVTVSDKKKQPTIDVAVNPNLVEALKAPVESTTNTDVVSENFLEEISLLTPEALIEEVGIDKVRALAKTLGYKIHHKTSDDKFAVDFLLNLKQSL